VAKIPQTPFLKSEVIGLMLIIDDVEALVLLLTLMLQSGVFYTPDALFILLL